MCVLEISAIGRPVVLIVEDEFLLRMNAAEMIGDAGFNVVEAGNADEAIAILEARRDLRLRQRRDRRFAGRQSLSAKALPLGANRRGASRIDSCRVSCRQTAVCPNHGMLDAESGSG